MSILKDIRWRFNFIIGPVFGILLFSYFIYHSIQGHHGLLAWHQLELRIDEAEKTFSLLDEKKMSLESRVKMLRPDSLDPDMLEEQSRKLLYFSHKDDIIVILNDKKIKS